MFVKGVLNVLKFSKIEGKNFKIIFFPEKHFIKTIFIYKVIII